MELWRSEEHEPLRTVRWDPARARDSIVAIASAAAGAFDRDGLWSAPADRRSGESPQCGLWIGAAGVCAGLALLARDGAIEPELDLVDAARCTLASPSRSGIA